MALNSSSKNEEEEKMKVTKDTKNRMVIVALF